MTWVGQTREQACAASQRINAERKRKVIEAYGGKCSCCGETELAFLTLDRDGLGGAAHRRDLGVGGSSLYWWLIKNEFPQAYTTSEGHSGKFRILCWNCNQATKYGQECPHRVARVQQSAVSSAITGRQDSADRYGI